MADNLLADKMRSLAEDIAQVPSTMPPSVFSRCIASALQWDDAMTRVEEISTRLPATAIRAYVANQPAVVVLGHLDMPSDDLVSWAASLAYQSTIHWGVASNSDELVIFNSHWLRKGDWFTLPPIYWSNPTEHLDLLRGLTPSGVMQGSIDDLATEFSQPEQLLSPVDEALVDRLDHWRDEALRHVSDHHTVDEKLQTLFSQLFVIRAVEDRALAPDIPALERAIVNRSEVNRELLGQIFCEARSTIQEELFEDIVLEEFPAPLLAGIIGDLHLPRQLPSSGERRYDFSWIEVRVLVQAYEKYLATLLTPPEPKSAQQQLWQQSARDADKVSARKHTGVYYTPSFLVNYVTQRCLDALEDQDWAGGDLPRIADFSCGSGSFLAAAADLLIERLREHNQDRNWARELVGQQSLVGIDNDARAVTLARLSLWLQFTQEPDPLPLPRLGENIVCGDSLSEELWEDLPDTYDIVLGNPPFGATGKTSDRAELSARFESARGRYDYSYLFVELALNRVKPGGVVGLVISNRLYMSGNARVIRDMLATRSSLLTLVDFGSDEAIRGTQLRVGIIIARRDDSGRGERNPRVIKTKRVPERLTGAMLYDADVSKGEYRDQYLEAYDTRQPIGGQPWLLLSKATREARIRLEEQSERLGEVTSIFGGILTGANDIFVVEVIGDSGGTVVQARNGLGDVFLVETSFLRPMIFGLDIHRYDVVQPTRYLVYPYRSGRVLTEDELKEEAPNLFQYLRMNQDLLASRRPVEQSGLKWYELSRPRDEQWMESGKLLLRDIATRLGFALDPTGGVYLVGGTALVPPREQDLLPLLGYLNSNVANWYVRSMTTPSQASFQRYHLSDLQRLPVPRVVLDDEGVTSRIADAVTELISAKQEGNVQLERVCGQRIDELVLDITSLEF